MGILLLVAVSLAAIASIAVLFSFDSTSTKLLKRMDQIMASTAQIQAGVDDVKTRLVNLETRVDKVIADIQAPAVTDMTASDAVLTSLRGIATDLDAFHAPLAATAAAAAQKTVA
jgi:uncharacterized protein YoxC